MKQLSTILYIEDDIVDKRIFEKHIPKALSSIEFIFANSMQSAVQMIEDQSPQIIISDYNLNDGTGLDIVEKYPEIPVILVSVSDDFAMAVEAMKSGAKDFLNKDLKSHYLTMLPLTIDKVWNSYLDRNRAISAEQRFTDLFENSNDLIQIVDDLGYFLYVNPAWCQALEYTKEDAVKMHFLDIIHERSRGHCINLFKSLESGNVITRTEILFVSKTGKKINVEGNISSKNSTDNRFTTRAIFRDITEKKEAERNLRKINQNLEKIVIQRTGELNDAVDNLKKINTELDTFLYQSSHHLKGPLARFSGLINLLKSYKIEENIAPIIHLMETNVVSTEKMISKLSEVSQLSLKERTSKIDLKSLITEYLSEHPNLKNTDKIIFKIEQKEFYANKRLVKAVLFNIIDNALVYRKGETHELVVTSRSSSIENSVDITISDNGSGIDQSALPKIFDMFFIGCEESDGQGLGLYAAKKAADIMKGHISASSSPGEFTTFSLTLPILANSATNNVQLAEAQYD